MPENGGGRDARSMAPTTAAAPPLVGYLATNSYGLKIGLLKALPTGSLMDMSDTKNGNISLNAMVLLIRCNGKDLRWLSA